MDGNMIMGMRHSGWIRLALETVSVFAIFFIGIFFYNGDPDMAIIVSLSVALFYLLVYVLTGKSMLRRYVPEEEIELKNRGSLGVLASLAFFAVGLVTVTENTIVFSSTIFTGLFIFFSSLGMLTERNRRMLNMVAAISLLPIPFIISVDIEDVYVKALLYLIGAAWLFFILSGAYGMIIKKKTKQYG
ncbi:hypothetical protein CUJ83_15145 [Methanocella sp. CWC-04]|uniref:Uncharacterized protein n=1 Tax=Methanooceanicella nereidis TaxID=2052831 RepID=A0AAP2W7E5_9EURY|nr:hypothetical protein [Methanocella sp. CWC-04]MCD1296338.1 hypothetical protein [Methanocella sp. CWC-04]